MTIGGRTSRAAGVVVALLVAMALVVPSTDSEANTVASNTAPAAEGSGYAWISYFRGLAGLGPVQRNATFEAEEALHVRYLANHALSCENDVHNELTDRIGSCGRNPYATAAGKAAAQNSNVTRINAPISDRTAVSNWFVSAFHALTLLDPRLRSTGYAAYYTPNPTGAQPTAYKFTAATDVYRGRSGGYSGQTVTFPASGAATPLLSYQVGTESPEPFRSTVAGSPCHSWGSRSLVSAPIVVQWPVGSHPAQGAGRIVDLSTGAALLTCGLTANQYPTGSLAQQFLLGTNRITKAAFYYAATPFVAGHRYRLSIAGVQATTFAASNLPSVPTLSLVGQSHAVAASWPAVTAGSGTVAYYRLTRFADPHCGRPTWTAVTTGQHWTMTGLVTTRWYFVQVAVVNSLGAVRTSACTVTRAR